MAATAADLLVKLAKNGLIAFQSHDVYRRCLIVRSTRGRRFSPDTTIPHLICPASTIAPSVTRPFRKPRHAFERSKTWQLVPSPILWWANDAVAGSSMSRQTAE